jgi:hypothetical protein
MRSFLPDLMLALALGRRALITKLTQEPIALLGFELLDDASRSMALQVGENAGKLRRCDDGMEMRVEYNPCMDLECFMLATVFEGIDEDVTTGGGGENRKPGDSAGGDEVGMSAFEDSIAATHDGVVGTKHSFEDKMIVIGVPKCNLGTREDEALPAPQKRRREWLTAFARPSPNNRRDRCAEIRQPSPKFERCAESKAGSRAEN